MARQRTLMCGLSAMAVLVGLLTVGPAGARAQYYDEREYRPLEVRYFYLGAMQRDFAPTGSNAGKSVS